MNAFISHFQLCDTASESFQNKAYKHICHTIRWQLVLAQTKHNRYPLNPNENKACQITHQNYLYSTARSSNFLKISQHVRQCLQFDYPIPTKTSRKKTSNASLFGIENLYFIFKHKTPGFLRLNLSIKKKIANEMDQSLQRIRPLLMQVGFRILSFNIPTSWGDICWVPFLCK